MTTLAAKNYSMQPCPSCHGEGLGVFASGARWTCCTCDGSGKVSKYPPARLVNESRSEPMLDRG